MSARTERHARGAIDLRFASRWRGVGAVALAIVALAGCARKAAPVAAAPIAVTVEAVRPGDAARGNRYSANIQPYSQVALAFQVTGYIDAVATRRGADGRTRELQGGDAVKKNEQLAAISEDNYRQQLNSADSQLAGANSNYALQKRNFDRARSLFDRNVIARADYDAAWQAYQSAEAQRNSAAATVRQAQINLGYCKLRSPMNGVILNRLIEIGSLAGPSVTAFQIADLREVKAVFGVSDAIVKHLRMGEALGVRSDAFPNASFVGTITRIAPNADPTTRVFDVEVTLPNADGRLRAGMIAALELGAPADTAGAPPAVPLEAIVRPPGDPTGYGVFVTAADGERTVARTRKVSLGEIVGNRIAVTEGLRPGDRVIVRGATIVTDGAAVRVMPQ